MRSIKTPLTLLLTLSLLLGLTVPAAASEAMGDDLTARETELHRQTQLSTSVFWSESYSDLRTENFITYVPNDEVKPIVTYGTSVTECTSVATAAQALEEEGFRVVAGINGDFYNTGNGLPIGIVVADGRLLSSDGGYYAVGFREDGTALMGKPGVKASVDLGYGVDDGYGTITQLIRPLSAVNKARVSSGGIYLYTYEFNDRHTTGTIDPGVTVLCTVNDGELAIGRMLTAVVEEVVEGPGAVELAPDQIALSAHGEANTYYVDALRGLTEGTEITVSISANEGWEDVEYAVGGLYSLVENGELKEGLPSGISPRTAIGRMEDGTLIFYTMDGRKSGYSIGCSLSQVGQRLMEMGCVDVIGLDGGGSTNLAITTPDSTTAAIYNTPSESGRKVSNQIFLVASNEPSGRLDHYYVSAESNYVLAGSTVKITAAAVDTNYIPMDRTVNLSVSAGSLEEDLLLTRSREEDIIVTASGSGRSSETVVHVIKTPDTITVKNGSAAISSLTVNPGSKVTLTAEAVWSRLPLKADAEAFDWQVDGDIGTIDEAGSFTAGAPGEGSITVAAGDTEVTIPVTVSRVPLDTVEDFEEDDTVFAPGSGNGMLYSRVTGSEQVRFGRGAGKFDYELWSHEGYIAEWRPDDAQAWIAAPYTSLNFWVCGDGSGNELHLLYHNGAKGYLDQLVTTLDFTGWKQVELLLEADSFMVEGLQVRAPMTIAYEGENAIWTYADTPRSGSIYIDQMVASFAGTMDNAAPVITAELDEEAGVISGAVWDETDGILPAGSVQVTYNGGEIEVNYHAESGEFTVELPETEEDFREAVRVTVTAKDASGNIGRASVDMEANGVEHKFSDIEDYWGAAYVDFLFNAGVTNGYADGSFKPNQNISRAQFSVMLYRYLGLQEEDYADVELPFEDRDQIGEYAVPAVKALYSEGVINGSMRNGKLYFNPNSPLTRAQAAAMIGRTQEKGYALSDLMFTDAEKIPAYAVYYIQTMAAQGILGGYGDNTFRPNNNITRGQMAKILYHLM